MNEEEFNEFWKIEGLIEECKVIGCRNHVMEIKQNGRAKSMKGTYGYCQIHNIEGLV